MKAVVSIHAPTRGATRSFYWLPSILRGFNPRTHTGCDFETFTQLLLSHMFQSTHPHGVRQDVMRNFRMEPEFQSTHPHGVRPTDGRSKVPFIGFQSTHPHGVRRVTTRLPLHRKSFNPRTHTGCDVLRLFVALCGLIVSIHAPTRGATISTNMQFMCEHVSIHAPTRGATKNQNHG